MKEFMKGNEWLHTFIVLLFSMFENVSCTAAALLLMGGVNLDTGLVVYLCSVSRGNSTFIPELVSDGFHQSYRAAHRYPSSLSRRWIHTSPAVGSLIPRSYSRNVIHVSAKDGSVMVCDGATGEMSPPQAGALLLIWTTWRTTPCGGNTKKRTSSTFFPAPVVSLSDCGKERVMY